MATPHPPAQPQIISKTCSNCKLSVVQQPGTRRTICPGCGSFYDASVANHVRTFQDGRLRATNTADLRTRYNKLHDEKQKERDAKQNVVEETTSPLQKISNFFNKIGPKRKNSSEKRELTLPDIDQSGSLTTSRGSTPRLSPRPPADPKRGGRYSTTRDQTDSNTLRQQYKTAKDSSDWSILSAYYSTTFASFSELNISFKKPSLETVTDSAPDAGLQQDIIETAYEILKKAPSEIQKSVLKAIINCLLKDKGVGEGTKARFNASKDDLRAYLILLQNPLFQNTTTFVIFAHLLRQIASLSDHSHNSLVHWFSGLSVDTFRNLVNKINKFISLRLYPINPQDLPPLSKCIWWIPSSCKVLGLLNAANTHAAVTIIPSTEFYNTTLDNVDLLTEYNNWQTPGCQANGGFTFCQYPFLLSISSKRFILQKDSEQQMIQHARKTLVAQVQSRKAPEMEALFLNLTVRRKNLVQDSLTEIATNKFDLKKKLKVTFVGEAGLDLGGLTKEWFLLLVKKIFEPEYGMFVYNKMSGSYWFSVGQQEARVKEFNLIGILMGLAVYNGINLDVKLPLVVYKKLLNPAVVPHNNPQAVVGILPLPTIDDLKTAWPEIASSLTDVLNHEGDIEDLCLNFQASIGQGGKTITEDLKPGGSTIDVTDKNKSEYVKLYLDWALNKSIYKVFRAFYHGFHTVCASNALLTLQASEVEILVNGSPDLDPDEIRKICKYDGYHPKDQNIKDFWELVCSFSKDGVKKLLRFITGSDRLPVGGAKDLEFKITRTNKPKQLPVAHTCFNLLILPAYNNKSILKQKLLLAVLNTEGFALE